MLTFIISGVCILLFFVSVLYFFWPSSPKKFVKITELEQPELKKTEKKASLTDASDSTLEVRRAFLRMRNLIHCRQKAEILAELQNTDTDSLFNSVENKFVSVDLRMYKLLKMSATGEELEKILEFYTPYYVNLISRILDLEKEKKEEKWFENMTMLNEFMNAWNQELEAELEQRKIQSNPSWYLKSA